MDNESSPCDGIERGDTVIFKESAGLLAGAKAIVTEVLKEQRALTVAISGPDDLLYISPVSCSNVEKLD